MSKEMRQYINQFNKFSLTESLNESDVSDSEIKKFNKLSHKNKINYLVDNFGMERVEANEICPDEDTKVKDLPKEIREYFYKK
jgi:hypothetical protein